VISAITIATIAAIIQTSIPFFVGSVCVIER
jgi:hypothetical protein